ncbi:MAG TPA: trimethylamine--corrinoid methyltransferase [Firmicutes bacterium]|nr:trimethylamine--corrinoid methyltransferase [Bacillota bacterium]
MIYRKFAHSDLMSEEELLQVHQASLEVLEKNGIELAHETARKILEKNGARVEGEKVFIPGKLIEEQLAKAPREFTLHARNPRNNVLIGGDNTALAPGYGAPFVMDLELGKRRNSTYADYVNFTKLSGASEYIDVVGGVLVEPTDLPDEQRHAQMYHAAVKYTDKAVMGSALGEKKARECVEMAAIVHQGIEFVKEHPVLLSLINTNSPLQLDRRMMESLLVYAEYKQPMVIASLSMTGTTAPVTLAAALVQQNAEVIACISIAQLVNPGAPVIYGSASSVVDLKTGGLAIGSPETALMFSGTAQLARYYKIPSRGGGSLTDSLLPDAQSGYESMFLFMAAVQSGFHFILHAAGLLENYMTMSYEKFIIDDEICGMVKKYFEGITVDRDHLGVETILHVGSGGNYLGEDHTFAHMRDMRLPLISSRKAYYSGKIPDTSANAGKYCQELLEQYQGPPLDKKIENELLTYIKGIKK